MVPQPINLLCKWSLKGQLGSQGCEGHSSSKRRRCFTHGGWLHLCRFWMAALTRSFKSASMLFKAGVERDSYFTNKDILPQVRTGMDVLDANEWHVFVFDNTTTCVKQADDALSARKMPKNPSNPMGNFSVEWNKLGADGTLTYGPNRKPIKEKVKMANGTFQDGREQEFYFPNGHPQGGLFKGMAIISSSAVIKDASGRRGRWLSVLSSNAPLELLIAAAVEFLSTNQILWMFPPSCSSNATRVDMMWSCLNFTLSSTQLNNAGDHQKEHTKSIQHHSRRPAWSEMWWMHLNQFLFCQSRGSAPVHVNLWVSK